MDYLFGVSFNCHVNGEDLGGAEECCDVAYVSNDKQKLIDLLEKDGLTMITEHEYVDACTDVGGNVNAVFVDQNDTGYEDYAVAVLINEPLCPTVI